MSWDLSLLRTSWANVNLGQMETKNQPFKFHRRRVRPTAGERRKLLSRDWRPDARLLLERLLPLERTRCSKLMAGEWGLPRDWGREDIVKAVGEELSLCFGLLHRRLQLSETSSNYYRRDQISPNQLESCIRLRSSTPGLGVVIHIQG